MARRTKFALAALLGCVLGSVQAQAPAPATAAGTDGGPARVGRPPDPVFDNPNPDPRDFEGLWLPGRAQPPEGVKLSGPILGGAAVNETSGSTLQCSPVWRLSGAGGGMSNYWVMGDKEIVLLSEEDMDVVRKIYLNATHPPRLARQPNGHSIGHWEGNTLVVDTIGFANRDGTPSDRHVVERFERSGGKLVDHSVVTEGGKSVSLDLPSNWRPDLGYNENVCEEGFRRYGLKDGKVVNFNTLPERQ
jgi:hypothetical protein